MSETSTTFGEFGARVMVEDEEVPHYAISVDPVKKEVSCWIASEAGKAFSIVWLELDVEYPCTGCLYLDGCSAGLLLRRSRISKRIVFQDTLVSDSLCRPYQFTPLAVTDDDTFLDSSYSCSVGEIKLTIHLVTAPVLAVDEHVYDAPHQQKVHERSKKAIAHQVSYGGEVAAPPFEVYDAKPIERLVTFIFKYRPLEMLQANGIAPRNSEPLEPQEHASEPPSPPGISLGKRTASEVKEESELEEESEDNKEKKREEALLAEVQGYLDEVQRCQTEVQRCQTEVQRCQGEIQRCQAEIQRIKNTKRSNLLDDGHPKKKVKKENKASKFIRGEVIDLT